MILGGKKKVKVADLRIGDLFVVPIELGTGTFCTCLYRCNGDKFNGSRFTVQDL